MNPSVSQSITQRSASNLAQALVVLPRDQRGAMAVLYAFCREVDDVADEDALPVTERRRQLAEWRKDVEVACAQGEARLPVNRELVPVIARYRLPFRYFDDLLRGVEMDLEAVRYDTYAELELYCYRVASVVGLLSIEIFGYRDPGCRDYAVALGKALQFTNILRDVGNDAKRGRIYLPLEELRRHGVSEAEILEGRYSERFRDLAAGFAGRAWAFYREARALLPREDRRSMVAAELMGAVYGRLLRQVERQGFRVLGERPIRLGRSTKVYLLLRTWLRVSMGSSAPNYG